MTKPPHELFSPERPVRSDFARGVGLSYAVRRKITLAVLACLVIGGGHSLWRHFSPSTPAEIPTIKADGAYKQRPEQPGGIDIPHQDVQVYHEIDGSAQSSNQPSVEHMLPPPETPVGTTVAPSSAVVTAPAGKMEELLNPTNIPTTVTPETPSAPPAPTSQTSEVQPVASAAPPAAAPVVPPASAPPSPKAAPAQAVTHAAPPKPAAAKVPKPVAPVKGKTVIVQLASVPSEAAAKQRTQELQTKYQLILGAAHLQPVRADLGKKGVFYRIQTAPLPEAQATAICSEMKDINAGCLLVRH